MIMSEQAYQIQRNIELAIGLGIAGLIMQAVILALIVYITIQQRRILKILQP